MKRPMRLSLTLLALLAGTGCANMQMPHFGQSANAQPQTQAQQPQTPPYSAAGASDYSNQTFASNSQDCSNLATRRMAMFDRPDTFPTSDKEKHDAYQALYTECVNGNTGEIAAASHNNVPYNVASASQFANLSPAAGGNGLAPTGNVMAPGYPLPAGTAPGATVIVVGGNQGASTASQLSSLSPASGGAAPTGATVVLVQAPGQGVAAAPRGQYQYASATPSYYTPTTPLPVAVPVPPTAQSFPTPAQAAAAAPMPRQTMPTPGGSAAYQPVVTSPAYQPSLASANANAAGIAPTASHGATADQQLENVLEK